MRRTTPSAGEARGPAVSWPPSYAVAGLSNLASASSTVVHGVTSEQLRLGPLPAVGGPGIHDLAEDIADLVIQKLAHPGSEPVTAPEPVDDKLVFVLSAFTPDMDPAYDAVAAAAQTVGLHAERVKDVKGDYRITEKILAMIRQARLIVANLTHDRPNVYFELGYARGLGKTIITIMRSGTAPHFDVYDWTYLEYFDSRPLECALAERLRFELRET